MRPTSPACTRKATPLEEATVNAQEALDLYVEGLRERRASASMPAVIRRKFPVSRVSAGLPVVSGQRLVKGARNAPGWEVCASAAAAMSA